MTFDEDVESILTHFKPTFRLFSEFFELSQNVRTDLERKKNDLAKRSGEKLRIWMLIAPPKGIGHITNRFFEKIPKLA